MKLIPLVSIRVLRDGQSIAPVIGKPFDFTADEKADLDKIHAEHNVESYREPINEAPVEAVKVAEAPVEAVKVAEVAPLTAAEKKVAAAAEKKAAAAAAKLAGEAGNNDL